jgi:hypothetical protein
LPKSTPAETTRPAVKRGRIARSRERASATQPILAGFRDALCPAGAARGKDDLMPPRFRRKPTPLFHDTSQYPPDLPGWSRPRSGAPFAQEFISVPKDWR